MKKGRKIVLALLLVLLFSISLTYFTIQSQNAKLTTLTQKHPLSHDNRGINSSSVLSGMSPVNHSIQNIKKKKRIAFVITITKDGPFQDGAAVLAYSIFKSHYKSTFLISLIAFVHPSIKESRSILENIGYHVIDVPVPINSSAIKFDFLREKIEKNGCCGSAELIKLTSYR